MARYRLKRSELVDAVQLPFDVTVHYPSSEMYDATDVRHKAGSWFIKYKEGGSAIMEDVFFSREYERVTSYLEDDYFPFGV